MNRFFVLRRFFILAFGLLATTTLFAQRPVVTHNINGSALHILAANFGNDYRVTGTGAITTNTIIVDSGYQGTITLERVNIQVNGSTNISAMTVYGKYGRKNTDPYTKVTIILKDSNVLRRLYTANNGVGCGLRVDQGAQIHIKAYDTTDNASGKLLAYVATATPTAACTTNNTGGSSSAAIGSFSNAKQGVGTDACILAVNASYRYTAGGNIIISSGTIVANGGYHGAGIGGGHYHFFAGIIVIYGGIVTSRGGGHAAGIGSGCPSGSGVTTCAASASAIVVLPPAQITATSAQSPTNAVAGAGNMTYINDPLKPLITVHTQDSTPNANIYMDLLETPRLEGIFDSIGLGYYNLAAVGCGGVTNAQGLFQFRAELQQPTTFFTDAGSLKPATMGRPYEPVTRTVTGTSTTQVSIILPMLQAEISFTDYPSVPLDEGYTAPEAQQHAFRTKITYNDPLPMTLVKFSLQSTDTIVGSDYDTLVFLAADGLTVIPAPTQLDSGDVYYVIVPLKTGKPIGIYNDVLQIRGSWKGYPLIAPIRKVVQQRVMVLDVSQTYIKVHAAPTTFTHIRPVSQTVNIVLNINHSGLHTLYDAANVVAKYLVTTDSSYSSAVATVPISAWSSLNIPTADSVDRSTTVSFSSLPAGVYYIHWYVESGILYSNTQAIGIGDFGPYAICDTVNAGSISGTLTVCSGKEPQTLTGTSATGGCDVLTYNWQSSTDGITWSNIVGSNTQNYTTLPLNTTTYYRRQTIDPVLGTFNSNVLQITVIPTTVPTITIRKRN